MKVVFFGTPDFAVPSLKILHESDHTVVAVVTAPDKQRGRGRKVSYTAVKQYALDNNIPVLQPEKMKDPQFIEDLKELNADLFVVVAFRILPEAVYAMPKFGSFNLHGSLLPKYRGAAPMQWALMNGDEETGVTTFFLEKHVDTGNIILQEIIPLTEDDDLGTLHDRMSEIGASTVLNTVNLIEQGSYELKPQNESLASPAPKINKETCLIDWNKSAKQIFNQIRGLSPVPGAYFTMNNKLYKVYRSTYCSTSSLKPGEVKQTKNELFIGCGEGELQVLEIQPEGRKRMVTDEFLRGYSILN